MGEVIYAPAFDDRRALVSSAQSLLSDRAYARHNHGADRAFWIGGPDNACSEINPDRDGVA